MVLCPVLKKKIYLFFIPEKKKADVHKICVVLKAPAEFLLCNCPYIPVEVAAF